jgi:competence protein ComEC
VCTSIASWGGSLPLVAQYFHLVTPGSLVANLLAVPLSSFALASTLGSLACGQWLPALTELFNHSAWFWMQCMVWVCNRCAACPGTWFHVPSPGWPWILAYYAGLGLLLGNARLPSRWRVPALTGTLLAFALGIGLAWWHARSSTTLTLLALRSGSAQLLDAPGRAEDLLIDTGDDDGAAAILQPFLGAQGYNRLPRTVLTHGDARHVNGLPRLARAFLPGPIAVSPIRFRSTAYRRILAERAPPPGGPEVWRRREVRSGWTVLHPDDQAPYPQADDNTLVLLRNFGGVRVLLLSDIGPSGQTALLDRGEDLRAEVVIASLPSRGEPLSPALLDAVRPQIVLLQDAEYPATDRAGVALRARLETRGIPVWYTTEEGSITLRFEAGHCDLRTMTGRRWRWPSGRWGSIYLETPAASGQAFSAPNSRRLLSARTVWTYDDDDPCPN